MTDRVKLDWLVPESEWQRFRSFVEDEHEPQDAGLDGYLGREAESAMQEYADVDGYARVEEKVDRLVQAAGRRPSGSAFEEKNSLTSEERVRVTVRVERDVKSAFRDVASESDHPFGVEFAHAIRAYRDGGRPDRLEEKLDRVIDDAERLLADLKPNDQHEDATDADSEHSEESLPLAERKTLAVIDELADQFTDDELVETIERVAGVSSDPSIKKYRNRVVDRLEVERHPNAPHLWVSHEYAEEIADGEPRVIRQDVKHLDRDDRVERTQLAVGRAAAERESGEVRVQSPAIQEQVLDDEVSRATTLSLMRSAALDSDVGIGVDDSTDPAALEVDMAMVEEVDPDLAYHIIYYRNETETGIFSAPTATTMNDYVNGPGDIPPENASAFADGGSMGRWNEHTGKPRHLRDDNGGGGGE